MTDFITETGYVNLRPVPGQPLTASANTIIHPTLKYARRNRQYGTVLCEVELVWDDHYMFGIFLGAEPDWVVCVGRRNEYREAYIDLLHARLRDDRAVIRFLRYRPTTGQDILHNINDDLIVKAPVRKAA